MFLKKISPKALLLLALAAGLTGCFGGGGGGGEEPLPPVNTNPTFELQGFNICAWGKDWWSNTSLVDKALRFAAEEGANFLALDWPVNFYDDGTMVPFANSLHPYWNDIQRLINKAKTMGFYIMLKPHTTKADSPENRNIWNTDINTFLPGKFFPAYKTYLTQLCAFATQNNVDAICIGTEMNHLDWQFNDEWTDLITTARNNFAGKLTYDALFNRWYRNVQDVEEVIFWDQLDFIGCSLYVPITKDDNATVETLKSGWFRDLTNGDFAIFNIIDYLKTIAQQHNKQFMALEGGYPSVSGGLYDFSGPSETKTADYDLQSRGLDAYLGVLEENKENWFKGVSLWQITPAMLTPEALQSIYHTQEFTVYQKPAAEVVKRHYVGMYLRAVKQIDLPQKEKIGPFELPGIHSQGRRPEDRACGGGG
ncbi:MAG: glycoside hydrolase family 113 [Bacillota bacterium]